MPNWWTIWIGPTLFLAVILYFAYHGYRRPESRIGQWSGIPEHSRDQEIVRAKTFWDWLHLLGVPLTVAFVGFGYSMTVRQADKQLAEKQREADLKIAKGRMMDDVLKSYLDTMGQLLIEGGLNQSKPPKHVLNLARAHTLTALDQLDGRHKGSIIVFLAESGLIRRENPEELPRLSLWGANLTGVELNEAHLPGIEIWGANLDESHFANANLRGASLTLSRFSAAYLVGVQLDGAYLRETNFHGARLMGAQLEGADLASAVCSQCDLSHARLESANLSGTILEGARLIGTSLYKVNGLSQIQLNSTLAYHGIEYLPTPLATDSRPYLPFP